MVWSKTDLRVLEPLPAGMLRKAARRVRAEMLKGDTMSHLEIVGDTLIIGLRKPTITVFEARLRKVWRVR